MFEKSFLIVREVTDLTWFSNETTDKCWSTLCKKRKKKSRGIHHLSTRELLRSFHIQGWYTKHSRVRIFSCANPFLSRKVTVELHASNLFLHRRSLSYSFKSDTYETVSGISSSFLKWPAHNKNLLSQSVGLYPGTPEADRPRKNNETHEDKTTKHHQKQQSERLDGQNCNKTS